MFHPLNRKSIQGRKGFTLIEILVIIAIISILASILFPIFARARENARRSSCQSNLKQIGLGMMQYTQDFDERLPLVYSDPTTSTFGWMRMLQPYIKSEQLFQCPSDSVAQTPLGTFGPGVIVFNATDYFYNMNLGYGSLVSGVWSNSLTLSSLEYPANIVAFGDHKSSYEGVFASCISTCTRPALDGVYYFPDGGHTVTDATLAVTTRHLGGANYAFADGHVKFLTPEKISDAVPSGSIFTMAYK